MLLEHNYPYVQSIHANVLVFIFFNWGLVPARNSVTGYRSETLSAVIHDLTERCVKVPH